MASLQYYRDFIKREGYVILREGPCGLYVITRAEAHTSAVAHNRAIPKLQQARIFCRGNIGRHAHKLLSQFASPFTAAQLKGRSSGKFRGREFEPRR